MVKQITWSTGEYQTLRDFAAQGLSCSLIADAVNAIHGNNRSRNSVVGALDRLKQKGIVQAKAKPSISLRTKEKPEVVYDDSGDVFIGRGTPTLECTGCRWPLSRINGIQHHCNSPIHHKSYCELHHSISLRRQ